MPENGCDFVLQQIEKVTDGLNVRFTILWTQCEKINNMIISLMGYIQGVFKMFIVIHVTSLGALDGQESVTECSCVNVLKHYWQLPERRSFRAARVCVLCAHTLDL
jgi:hypothetical protein